MQIFNLKELNQGQDVPKVLYLPVNVRGRCIYLEKLIISLEDSWSEGIWEYNIDNNEMIRLDQGQHTTHTQLYDLDTPSLVCSTSKSLESKIYFSTITEIDDEDYIEFYELDLKSRVQKNILGFKFEKDSFMYKSMEVLAPGYLLFRLSYDLDLADTDFFDNLYLIDVAQKKYYEIEDEIFKVNFGKKITIGEDPNSMHLVMDEYFLGEEEQYDILVSDEIELAFDLPGSITIDTIHQNSIKIIKLHDFVEQVKSGVENIEFTIIDQVQKEGCIRILEETKDYIYYKKEIYEFALLDRGDFISRRRIGTMNIYCFDKNSLDVSFVANIPKESEVKASNNKLYLFDENENELVVRDLKTHSEVFKYKKQEEEEFQHLVDYLEADFFVISTENPLSGKINMYKIIDLQSMETLAVGDDILRLGEYLFVI